MYRNLERQSGGERKKERVKEREREIGNRVKNYIDR